MGVDVQKTTPRVCGWYIVSGTILLEHTRISVIIFLDFGDSAAAAAAAPGVVPCAIRLWKVIVAFQIIIIVAVAAEDV